MPSQSSHHMGFCSISLLILLISSIIFLLWFSLKVIGVLKLLGYLVQAFKPQKGMIRLLRKVFDRSLDKWVVFVLVTFWAISTLTLLFPTVEGGIHMWRNWCHYFKMFALTWQTTVMNQNMQMGQISTTIQFDSLMPEKNIFWKQLHFGITVVDKFK